MSASSARSDDIQYVAVDNTGGFVDSVHFPINSYAGDGAITVAPQIALLTKGTAGAYTLAAPTATVHDGMTIEVISKTAAAHVITCPAGKVNGGATCTFTAAIGNSVVLVAHNGVWYSKAARNATFA